MAFDISKVPAEDSRGFYYWRTNANPADIASYYGMKKNLETAEQEVDPIQSAINGVTSTAPVSLGVDSLDQAITPLDSSRTTSQLFSDYGAAPQQETAVTAVPTQATADLVAPTYNPKDILKQANGLMDVDLANDLNGDGRITSADALIAAKTQNITTPTAQQETTEPVVAPTSWSNGGPPNLNAEGIDLNKKIATNSYGGALKYSQLPPEDQAVVDARRAASVGIPPTTYQGVVGQDYGVGQQYETPEEALSALPAYLDSLEQQREVTDKEFNRLNYDPSEFVRAGFSPTPGSVSKGAALDSTIDYITKNKIPLSKEVDGQTRYLTTGLGADVFRADENFDYKAGEYKALGPVGTYSTIHVDPESPLNNPILNVVGAFLPPVALATTAMKAITGETLHAGDWLKLANAGLSEAGVIKPPSAGAGGMGPVDNGVGLFGTTYDQTQNIMEAAAAVGSDGNPAEILIKGFGVTDDVLDKIGIDSTTFDNSIVDYDAFVEGVEEAASRVAGGDNIEEALKAGALDYIVETAPDIDLGVVTDAVKAVGRVIDDNIFQPIIETVGDIDLGDFEDTVKDLGREFDDEVLQEIKGGIETFAPQVEDFVKTVGGGVVDVAETVGGAAVDVVETVGGGVADALEPIGTAITDIAKVTGSTVGDVLEGVGDIAGDLSDEIGDAIKAGGDALEDFITPIGETIEDIAKATGSTVEDVLKGVASVGEDIIGEVGDVGQDVIDALEPIGETIEDIAKATGSTVEDVLKGVASVGEDILGGVGDVGQEVIDALGPLGSTLEDFAKATGKTLEEVVSELGGLGEDILGGVADVGGEVIDAVKASGLSTEGMLQSGFAGLSAQQAAEAESARRLAVATRTTDSLFSEFKGFKTKIGETPIELVELIQRNRA